MKWRMRHFLLLLFLFSFALIGQVSAQVANLRILSINSDEFPTMRVVFDARNRNGVPIENITPEQLTIEEDKQAVDITELTSYVNAERPISLALVIDVSPSAQGQPLENAKQAANNLLDQLNEQDRMALISVRTESSVDINELDPEHEVNFTTDRNAVRNVVDFLQLAPDNTALYDAMFKAVRLTANENVANRAIILMTDGFDSVSRVSTSDDPIDEANRNSIPIFTIGLGEPRDEGYLERVAVRTGGTFKETNNPEELSPLFSNVLELLKKEYTLTYQSALQPGALGEHNLSISTRLEGRPVQQLGTFTLPGGEAPPTEPPPATGEEETEGTEGTEETEETPTEVPEEDESATEATEEQPAETVEPEEEKSWLEENLTLVIGIAVVLLLLIIALIAFLVMRGRNEEEQEDWNASPSTVQSVTPYPSKVGPVTQQQPWPAEGEWKAPADHTQVGYDYPSGGQGMDDRGIYPQTQHVAPSPPVGQGGTIPANPISPIPPTQAIPVGSADSEPSAPKKTVIFTRPGAKKKPYLLRQEDNQRFELVSHRIFIGRSPDNGIHLNNETVSGQHAVIVKRDNEVFIQDTGSTNGTFLNEEEVKGRLLLKQGDVIRFGKIEMIFHTGEEVDEK